MFPGRYALVEERKIPNSTQSERKIIRRATGLDELKKLVEIKKQSKNCMIMCMRTRRILSDADISKLGVG